MLQVDGWSWREWVPPKQRPKRLALDWPDNYMEGSQKIWFASAATVSDEYLRCLCSAEDVFKFDGVDRIPHRADESTYAKLLKGIVVERPLALHDIDIPDALEDVTPADEAVGMHPGPEWEAALEAEMIEDLEHIMDGDIDDDPDDEGGGGHDELPAPVIPPVLPVAPVGAPLAIGPAGPAPAALVDFESDLVGSRWGAFGISIKRDKTTGVPTGWQGSCPFHKKKQ